MSKIFILEDDPNRIEWFQKKFDGCDLTIVSSAKEACHNIKNNSYDIIFLDRDISDPNETGEDVAWYMAEHKLAENTPVIIHSANERGQRVIYRYLNKYKKNVYQIPFRELRGFSQIEIFKKVSNDVKNSKEVTSQSAPTSVFDALFNSMSFSDASFKIGIKSSRVQAAANLFKVWKDPKNKVGSNIYRKPLELSIDDVDTMEKEGLVNCVGDKIKITRTGGEVLKTMILGDDRSVFDKDYNEPIDIVTAESNIVKKKKTIKAMQKSKEDAWWNDIFKK